MSTVPTPIPATGSRGFWAHLKALLPAIEQATNVALMLTPLAGFEPLIAGLESAVTPAIQSIGSGQTVPATIMSVYAATIGVLETLKATPGLPAATLAEVESYITASQAGVAGYMQAQSGFNPANYTPVTPIP